MVRPIFQHPHKVLFLDMLSDEVLGLAYLPEDLVECGAPWAQNKSKLKLSSIGYLSETITLTRFRKLSGQRHFPTDITLGAVSFSISCWALNHGADVKIQAAVPRSVDGVRLLRTPLPCVWEQFLFRPRLAATTRTGWH